MYKGVLGAMKVLIFFENHKLWLNPRLHFVMTSKLSIRYKTVSSLPTKQFGVPKVTRMDCSCPSWERWNGLVHRHLIRVTNTTRQLLVHRHQYNKATPGSSSPIQQGNSWFIATLYGSPIQQGNSWFIVTYSYTFKCTQVLKLLPQKHWIT